MASKAHITTGELAAELGEPIWRVRRTADALGVDLPRAGLYRLIPPPLAERIRAVLKKAPALETKAAAAARMEGRRDE